ncbi:IS200/IS605 family transposase [Chryseolinea sp. T2]|uniref:IS200/IS605 family transposase n=1 Tax=Chryseolinea sp. T2 TaxID=3129255 RepID=UPI0030771CD5
MAEPQTKLWIHAILATRAGRQLITNTLESRLQNFFHDVLMECGCTLRIVNGMADHVHLLFLLNPRRSPVDVMRKLKGQSSRWINQNQLSIQKFAWHPGFTAFSVSESQVQKVFDYITNQKEHHLRESFEEEHRHITSLHNLGALPGSGDEVTLRTEDHL